MKKMLYFIDYLYYRIYRWYERHGDSQPGLMACIVITRLCLFFMLILFLLYKKIFFVQQPQHWLKWLGGMFYFIMLGLLLRRYSKIPISAFDLRWKDEDARQKKKRGWGIVFLIVGMFACVILGSI